MASAKSTADPDSLGLPAQVGERIEVERRRLQNARSILAALVFSVNHDADDVDAADVASVVFDLVDHAIDALDLVDLVHGPRRRQAG